MVDKLESVGADTGHKRTCAPIALFCYNRPAHLGQVLEALQSNRLAGESALFLFCDGPRNEADRLQVDLVRGIARRASGFAKVSVRIREVNAGLARSIIEGVTEMVRAFGKVIVLEDDLITSPFFLDFMNDGLDFYESEERVASIHGYVYPVGRPLPESFFLRGADCWGWATWARAWRLFEPDGAKLLRQLDERGLASAFDLGGAYPYRHMLQDQIRGRNDSWAIRWHASIFLREGLTLYPGTSLVNNIGNDASGTHSRATRTFEGALASQPIRVGGAALEPCGAAEAAFAEFFRRQRGWLVTRILRRLARGWAS